MKHDDRHDGDIGGSMKLKNSILALRRLPTVPFISTQPWQKSRDREIPTAPFHFRYWKRAVG